MCDHCMKHGSGGKWYLNAAGYSEEVARTHNLREFLLEQYRNFEQISVRKVAGISPAGMDRVFRMPIIGRLVKRSAERLLHSTCPPRNPFRPEGHIGQVVPLEDGVAILETCAAEPIIEKNCGPKPCGGSRSTIRRATSARSGMGRTRTSTTCVPASPPNVPASAPVSTSGSSPSTRRNTLRACTTVSAAACAGMSATRARCFSFPVTRLPG